MIWLYSGTPGSGKSYHAATEIVRYMRLGKGVICNFPIKAGAVKGAKSVPQFVDGDSLKPGYFVWYAMQNHYDGKEGQTLIVIDEAQLVFNARESTTKGRKEWLKFFQLHRHLGYDVLLIAQSDRMLDRQIRALLEYDVRHRKANNFGFIGLLLSVFTRRALFLAIQRWYGIPGKDGICDKNFFWFRAEFAQIYDSYALFDMDGLAADFDIKPYVARHRAGGDAAPGGRGSPGTADAQAVPADAQEQLAT